MPPEAQGKIRVMPPISLEETPVQPKPAPPRVGAFAPLSQPAFRLIWGTWLIANVCMWMNDVAAAWMMSALTTTPIWVALVQSASTLPVFLFGLPSGAMADILDRRRWLVATQFWLAGVAALLSVAVVFDWVNAPVLLILAFANGIGLALRWPVFSAIISEVVARPQLPAALGLNGIAMNAARIVGPLAAGALIASAGSLWVFLLNAVLSVASGVIILRWRRESRPDPLGREHLVSAMRVGVQFVRQSMRMRAVLARISIFFLHSTALLALLPLLARRLTDGGAGMFTLLLAAMGTGAIVAVLFLPRLRQGYGRDALVLRGAALQSAATVAMALAPNGWAAVPAMLAAGVAWIMVANTLSVSAQLALPDWVRARGLAIFQMAMMGATAFGAALWGQIATLTSLQHSLWIAAATGLMLMLAAIRFVRDASDEDDDMRPAKSTWRGAPVAEVHEAGRIVVTIEYRIVPARADAFVRVMEQTRRARLSQGAIAWELLHDLTEPERYVEQIVDASWTEHLRRFNRATAADLALRERRVAFHQGDEAPVVARYVVAR